MFVEKELKCKKFVGVTYKRIPTIKGPVCPEGSVVLRTGIDSASSDETTDLAKVQKDARSVQLVHLFGAEAVLGDTLETFQVNKDRQTRNHLMWIPD